MATDGGVSCWFSSSGIVDVEAPAFEPRRPRAKSPAGRASRGGERRINNAREVKILMLLPDGRNGSNPPSRSRERTIDTKLLIYGLFQKGRVLAQDGIEHR